MRYVWKKHSKSYFTGSKEDPEDWFISYYRESLKFELKAVNTQFCDYLLENDARRQPAS